jgi:hypothetical protein
VVPLLTPHHPECSLAGSLLDAPQVLSVSQPCTGICVVGLDLPSWFPNLQESLSFPPARSSAQFAPLRVCTSCRKRGLWMLTQDSSYSTPSPSWTLWMELPSSPISLPLSFSGLSPASCSHWEEHGSALVFRGPGRSLVELQALELPAMGVLRWASLVALACSTF